MKTKIAAILIIFTSFSLGLYSNNLSENYKKAIKGKWVGKTTFGWFNIPVYFYFNVNKADMTYSLKVVSMGITKHQFGGTYQLAKMDSGPYKGRHLFLLKVAWTKNKNRDFWVFLINSLSADSGVLRLTNGPKLEYNPIHIQR